MSDHIAYLRYVQNDQGETSGIELCDSNDDGAFKVYRKPEPRLALMDEMAECIKDYLKLLNALVHTFQVPEAAPLYKDMVSVESLLSRYEEMEGKCKGANGI